MELLWKLVYGRKGMLDLKRRRASAEKKALLKNEWVLLSWETPFRPSGRIAAPTPCPAPGRGSPRRRTGSGAGAARLCLPQALERWGEFGRIKGSLRRAAPALDPSSLTHSKFKRGRKKHRLLQCVMKARNGEISSRIPVAMMIINETPLYWCRALTR